MTASMKHLKAFAILAVTVCLISVIPFDDVSADSDDYFRSSRGAIVMPSGCTWYSRQNMSPSVLHAPGPAQEIRNERCTDPSQFTRLP